MRKRLALLAAAVLALLAIGGSAPTFGAPPGGGGGGGTTTTTLPPCSSGVLVPELGAVTINQGLGSYADQKLVAGKETLVRFFLKLPAAVGTTCSGSISVVNPTEMTVVDGSTDLLPTIAPYQSYPSGGLQITSSTVSVNSNADPIFVVPASRVNPCNGTPCATTGTFARNFRAKISYIRNGATGTVLNTTLTSPISGNFDQRSNALRILVVPMGDINQAYSTQFSTIETLGAQSAEQAVQNGMNALSRLLPVPAGVSGNLAATSGGIRYQVDFPAMVNLRAVPGAYNSNNKFCGKQENFDAIKGQLAHFLQAYNGNDENAAHPADRVLGVVDARISDGSSFGCAEGMASTSSTEAWVRAIPDQPASGRTPAVPSMTGGLMAMELLHTFGQENVALGGLVHSTQIQADGTSPDRGYHLTSRSYIAKDLTVLNFVNTSTAPWNNNTTLLERDAFQRALCNLGGSLQTFCTLLADVGTPPAAAGTPHFVISATTDGTPGGTHVTNSYLTHGQVLETPCVSAETEYNLAFTPSEAEPCNVPSSALTSEHDEGTHENTTTALITGAFPVPDGQTEIQLRKGTTVLHTVYPQRAQPEILSVSNLGPGGGVTQSKTITTPEILPTPDIYFLADTTGSMGLALDNVQANASDILDRVKEEAADPRFGAGDYRDFRSCTESETAPCFPFGDTYAFNNAAPVPATGTDDGSSTALAAIEDWEVGNGGDQPEGQLFALDQLSSPSSAGWRSDSSRILVWFGDNPGHDPVCAAIRGSGAEGDITKGTVTDALDGADVRVIAVTLDTDTNPEFNFSTGLNGDPAAVPGAPGDYEGACGSSFATDSANQATAFADATGGVVKEAASAADVSAEILAGLTNLPATVTPDASCDEGLSITFAPESETVTSGEDVTFTEQVDISEDATPGDTLTCRITFLINDMVVTLEDGETPDPAFQQTISLTVDDGSTTETTVRTADEDPKAEIFVSCDGSQLPSHVGVPGTEVEENIWRFNTNSDTSNTCADSGGTSQITVLVSDGANQVSGAVGETGTTIEDDRESPTASIYAPAVNYVNSQTQPFALNGQVVDPDDGPLEPSWTITGPPSSGISITVTGDQADVRPPSGTWPLGNYTVRISGTDVNGNTASTSVIVHVLRYEFSGFLDPIKPLPMVNPGKVKSTIPVKWQLRDQAGNFISDLGVVAAIRVASTPCPVMQAVCDTTPTGATQLRYDAKPNQFVYNWLTPSTPGTYVLSVHFTDGSTYAAYFKLTK
jgi:integrin beta-like protein